MQAKSFIGDLDSVPSRLALAEPNSHNAARDQSIGRRFFLANISV